MNKKQILRKCLLLYGGLALVIFKEEVDEDTKNIIDEVIEEHNLIFDTDIPNTYSEEALDHFIDNLVESGKAIFNQKWTGEHTLKQIHFYVDQIRDEVNGISINSLEESFNKLNNILDGTK